MWVIFESILWTSLGVLPVRLQLIPRNLPRLLGRSLYWIGVPLQILVLARRSNFSQTVWFPPLTTLIVLLSGLGLALLILGALKQLTSVWLTKEQIISSCLSLNSKTLERVAPQQRSGKGSFILASMLGNTGFIGIAIAPTLVSQPYWSWIALYGVTHNLFGSYGIGVVLASSFGRSPEGDRLVLPYKNRWWIHLRDLLSVPSLWAFLLGWWSRDVRFAPAIESAIQISVQFVVPGAFLLIGMQLGKLQGIQGLQIAVIPSLLKMLILPGLVGLSLTLIGIVGDGRLALVLMSGMPTAFASVILAEEYNLDRQIAASSILLSTVTLPLIIPLWLALFS
ncbi:AEC family transporter [Pleurocapsales cyanobacterium LEGE 06147]|nr:AEC family transporter [Pleurocapsales cyanobacterium LEGE 06147]